MPLDPVIAQGFRGIELQNPLDAYARVQQIQSAQQQNALAQQQNQLNALKMQEYQREAETTNRLRSLDPNAPNYMSEVTRLNPELGSQLMLRSKQQTAAERAAAASDAEGRAKNLSYWQGMARDSARTPTDEVVGALARRAVELKITDEATASSQLSQILSMPLEQRSQLLAQYGAAAAAAPATPADVATMKSLGFPLTQQGYEQFRAAQRQDRLKTPEQEAQDIRIALASRPPAQPRAESPPVAVVDEATGKTKYVSREEAIGKTPASAMEGLAPKEIQKREAAHPQATAAIKGIESKSDALLKDLKALRDDPGLEQITGMIYGRTGSVSREGSRAQALYDKIVAKGGFEMLQQMRETSKTGGALGNISNQEGQQLKAAFGALDRRQNTADVRAAIDQIIGDVEGAKTRSREAYDSTYSYKTAPTSAAKPSLDSIFGPK
jgi:hypothetical protein